MRPIDADALRDSVLKWLPPDPCGQEEKEYPFETDICASLLMEIEEAPTVEPEPPWIPCSERMPEEDHWLGGSGRQFSDEVLVSIANDDDEDTWTYISQTIDGEWALELPSYCKIIAWMPLPEPYEEEQYETD